MQKEKRAVELKYFIGADVHASTTTLVVLDAVGQVLDARTVVTTERDLREYVASIPSPKGMVMEETELAQWLYTVMQERVSEFVVCDPYRNHLLKEGAKTDKIDARRLAELYRAGLVKPVFHTMDHRMGLRRLTSLYRETIKSHVRVMHQEGALRRQLGSRERFSQGSLEKRLQDHYGERLSFHARQRQQLVASFEEQAHSLPEVSLLKSIPGIGSIGAMKIVATVVDPRRFATKHQFWSYCGLVRHERASGGRCYGRQAPRANREMKSIMKTAAITSLKGEGPMRWVYEAYCAKGLAEHDARHALARKIAAIVLSCWKNKRKFDANFERKQKEKNRTKEDTKTNLSGKGMTSGV